MGKGDDLELDDYVARCNELDATAQRILSYISERLERNKHQVVLLHPQDYRAMLFHGGLSLLFDLEWYRNSEHEMTVFGCVTIRPSDLVSLGDIAYEARAK
jgi:hypothetical protein